MAIPSTTEGVRQTIHLTINSVDLSAYIRSSTLRSERNEEEYAASGSGDHAEWDLGRSAKMLDVTLLLDFYTAKVEDTLRALHAAAAGQAFVYGPKGSATGERRYTGTVKLPTMPFDSFDYNAISTVDVSLRIHGAMTRDTFSA